jgi:hypothetical protein
MESKPVKSKTMRKFLLAGVVLLALTFCRHESQRLHFYYEETWCDPWSSLCYTNPGLSNEALLALYLTDSLAIEFSNLHVTNDGTPDAYNPCWARSGRIFRLTADEAYADELIGIGFMVE